MENKQKPSFSNIVKANSKNPSKPSNYQQAVGSMQSSALVRTRTECSKVQPRVFVSHIYRKMPLCFKKPSVSELIEGVHTVDAFIAILDPKIVGPHMAKKFASVIKGALSVQPVHKSGDCPM